MIGVGLTGAFGESFFKKIGEVGRQNSGRVPVENEAAG